jgi:hypothetical protein
MRKLATILVIPCLTIVGLMGTTGIAFADPPEKVDGFVCPVLGGEAGQHIGNPDHSPFIGPLADGDYSIHGPDISVPIQATNKCGEGWPGIPGYARPGDKDYTAIWNYGAAPE